MHNTATTASTDDSVPWRTSPGWTSSLVDLPARARLQQMNAALRAQIEQREMAVLALHESDARFGGAFDHAPTGMGLVGLDGSWLKVNPALCDTLGHNADTLGRMGICQLLADDAPEADAALLQTLVQGRRQHMRIERRCLRSDGQPIWLAIALSVVPSAQGQPLYLIAHVQDITEQKRAADILRNSHAELERRVAERTRELAETNLKLEQLARDDSLTGLLNRRYLTERLEAAVNEARRYRVPLSLMMLDLDRFKEINDRHGHLAGDQAIGLVGSLLRRHLRNTDIGGRYGGDEFCIVLPHTCLADARQVAEKLRAALNSAIVTTDRGQTFRLSCSIGVAALGADAEDPQSLVAAADAGLYAAKHAGRNQVAGEDEAARPRSAPSCTREV